MSFYIFFAFQYRALKEKYVLKHPYKVVFSMILSVIVILLAMIIVKYSNIFSKNIAIINISILCLFYAAYVIYFMIISSKESILIKKINHKLNERNIEKN